MAHRDIHLELLLHRRVWAPSGESVGRIEEMVVNEKGESVEFHLGPEARLKRWMGKFFPQNAKPLRVPWDQIELTNPDRPRLRGGILLHQGTHR